LAYDRPGGGPTSSMPYAVRELNGEGMAMLIATHEMGFAHDVADEICFLHRLLEAGRL
jgi:ABC-type polar amino acid transport system ATPase subunit